MLPCDAPEKLLGKEFEKLCVRDALGNPHFHMSRYGVMGVFLKGQWRPVTSLPDFEGVLKPHGRQFIFEAKVTSGASFSLSEDKLHKAQINHLLRRAEYGAVCFLLIHFNQRKLSKKTVKAETWAFPVHPENAYWEAFVRKEVKSINILDCQQYGIECGWHRTPLQKGLPRPDLWSVILKTLSSSNFIILD